MIVHLIHIKMFLHVRIQGNVEYGTDDDVSLEGMDFNDYTASVDVKQLQDIASVSSGSVMSNIDWGAVDRMIADVH